MAPRRKAQEARYVLISVVAERYGIHPQTLRLYDQAAIERLETILTLTRDLGVNLAGVEVILNLREQVRDLQLEVDRLLELVRQEVLDRRQGVDRQHALVRVASGPLAKR